jgi:hypothetical protein
LPGLNRHERRKRLRLAYKEVLVAQTIENTVTLPSGNTVTFTRKVKMGTIFAFQDVANSGDLRAMGQAALSLVETWSLPTAPDAPTAVDDMEAEDFMALIKGMSEYIGAALNPASTGN